MNVMCQHKQQPMSIDAFFDWMDERDGRYELVDGMPRLQPWVKLNHNRIVTNLVATLTPLLDPAPYEIATGDFAVRVHPDRIRYADLMILPSGKAGNIRFVDDAIVLVEVVSPSTMHVDFGDKLNEYKNLETLDTYLVFAHDEPGIWQWTRDDAGSWP